MVEKLQFKNNQLVIYHLYIIFAINEHFLLNIELVNGFLTLKHLASLMEGEFFLMLETIYLSDSTFKTK